jgi:hypothetical protein
LNNDIKTIDSQNKSTTYVEVPEGTYNVEITRLEMGKTGEKSKNPGSNKLAVRYKILNGEYQGQTIFQHQLLVTPFGIEVACSLLKSLGTDVEVMYENEQQFENLINAISEMVTDGNEYELRYGKNYRGYPTFEIYTGF